MSNFIPNETVTMDDRDSPSMNNKILFLTKNKTEYFKNSVKPNSLVPIRHFEQMQEVLQKIIKICKQKYYSKLSKKLLTNKINPKCYWSILKSFLNNKEKFCIPPLVHNNQFVVDFNEKN